MSLENYLSYKQSINYQTLTNNDLPSSHKANYILTDHHELLEKNAFLDWDHQTIFDRKRTLAEQEKRVSVLNTCVFVIVDYQPNRFFSNVQIHKDQFLI